MYKNVRIKIMNTNSKVSDKCPDCGVKWIPLKKDLLPLLSWCPKCNKGGPFWKDIEKFIKEINNSA
jgi:hypothetical protein